MGMMMKVWNDALQTQAGIRIWLPLDATSSFTTFLFIYLLRPCMG